MLILSCSLNASFHPNKVYTRNWAGENRNTSHKDEQGQDPSRYELKQACKRVDVDQNSCAFVIPADPHFLPSVSPELQPSRKTGEKECELH